ncbi:uncharacterized protein LOC115622107 [Scaptodrosophila lebanonensis]|uniref:Uncharacterized protein LOC115622107 n=1 Tax=Drosophila lebanonensis TaxID=7225 RepID=A0A6J2T728_DROLE|nr:uncharacterized protein LOC115622107 [Scaptodrosophila lebanonensis]
MFSFLKGAPEPIPMSLKGSLLPDVARFKPNDATESQFYNFIREFCVINNMSLETAIRYSRDAWQTLSHQQRKLYERETQPSLPQPRLRLIPNCLANIRNEVQKNRRVRKQQPKTRQMQRQSLKKTSLKTKTRPALKVSRQLKGKRRPRPRTKAVRKKPPANGGRRKGPEVHPLCQMETIDLTWEQPIRIKVEPTDSTLKAPKAKLKAKGTPKKRKVPKKKKKN